MKDDDLKILSDLKSPEPGDAAREHAVSSAMDAFDAAFEEKTSTATQGNETGERPISIINRFWRFAMNSVLKPVWNMKPAAMAAVTGVVMVPLAGVVAWNLVQQPGIVPVLIEETAAKTDGDLQDKLAAIDEKFRDAGPATERRNRSEQERDDSGALGSSDVVSEVVDQPAPRLQEEKREAVATGQLLKQTPVSPKRLSGAKAKGRIVGTEKAASESLAAKPAPAVSSRRVKTVLTPDVIPAAPSVDGERYTQFDDNDVKAVTINPVSTFSIDVDTASYARVRAMLNAGNLPPKDMVRVEEMVNYFDYSYPLPETREQPFKPTVTIMPTPWNEHTKLMHIGIKGFDVENAEQPKANLVFLLDVSGSMNQPDKLPLLIKSFRLLLQKLNPTDTVSIVTYAGRAATVLKPTLASDRGVIVSALENLQAGGSTGGAQGIEQAYRLAQQSFVDGGVNRVMLATDGDFNVGISDPEQLKTFIAAKRKSGIFLSVFGFGRGNYNDALMQSLAQNGNGQAAYIDTLAEAQKTLVEEAGGTLFPIATDVKIQMEFDPAKIAEYRLIGYETRALKREDFNNDKVDAGDIGAGHTVTAVYELTPVGSPAVLNDPLRYAEKKTITLESPAGEIGFLKMRYKLPGENKSKLLTTSVNLSDEVNKKSAAPRDATFATAVAAFGQKLRGNNALADMSYSDIAELANSAKGDDKFGYRSAFVQLVRMAGSLSN